MRRLPQYLLSAHCLTIGRHSLSLWEESIAIHCSSLRLCEETPPPLGRLLLGRLFALAMDPGLYSVVSPLDHSPQHWNILSFTNSL